MTVVNIAQRVDYALMIPVLAISPILIFYFAHFTIDTVHNCHMIKSLEESGYSFQLVPSNSVAVLLPLDNEKERKNNTFYSHYL